VETALPLISFLGGLNESALNLLAKAAQRMVVPAGTSIVREGEPGNQMFLIESGAVRVCKRLGQPDETELATLGPGAFFGEMCILETLPRCATVQATVETVVIRLSSLTYYHLYRTMPDQFGLLILNLARDLSRRIRRLDEVFASRH
jgi:CRP/FNR family cyclic AMP-dependent transcriptional regulator